MSAQPAEARRARFVELLPIVIAIALYGDAQDRWFIAEPLHVLLVMVWVVAWGPKPSFWTGVLLSGLGVIAGLVMLAHNEPPAGALPPNILSGTGGGVAVLAAYFGLTRQRTAGFTTAWVLAAVSLQVPPGLPERLLLGMLALSTLGALVAMGSPQRKTFADWLGFGVFGALLLGVSVVLSAGVFKGDELVLRAIYDLIRDEEVAGGLGLEAQIDLEPRSEVEMKNRPVMEIAGRPPPRLRTLVLEEFTGFSWSVVGAGNNPYRIAPPRVATPPTPPAGDQIHSEILMLEPLFGVIPAPSGTYDLEGTIPRVEAGFLWRTPGPVQKPLTLDRGRADLLPTEPPPAAIDLKLPPAYEGKTLVFDQEQFTRIAQGIVKGAATNREKAERIEHFFQSEFTYALHTDLRSADSLHPEHPLLVMMKEHRPAYCKYFASAMAVLLRSVGVPARVVEGFLPQEHNPITGRTIVRVRDAHAWVEAYLPEEGRFVAFYPTPSQSREAIMTWERSGLAYTLEQAVFSLIRRAWLAVRVDPIGLLRAAALSPITWILVASFGFWRFWQGRKNRVRTVRQTALATDDPILRRSYARYLRLLRGASIVPGPDETDEEAVARLEAARGLDASAAAQAFLVGYRRARYGRTPASAPELGASIATLAQELRKKPGVKRAA